MMTAKGLRGTAVGKLQTIYPPLAQEEVSSFLRGKWALLTDMDSTIRAYVNVSAWAVILGIWEYSPRLQ